MNAVSDEGPPTLRDIADAIAAEMGEGWTVEEESSPWNTMWTVVDVATGDWIRVARHARHARAAVVAGVYVPTDMRRNWRVPECWSSGFNPERKPGSIMAQIRRVVLTPYRTYRTEWHEQTAQAAAQRKAARELASELAATLGSGAVVRDDYDRSMTLTTVARTGSAFVSIENRGDPKSGSIKLDGLTPDMMREVVALVSGGVRALTSRAPAATVAGARERMYQ